jgi:hypothetical protein
VDICAWVCHEGASGDHFAVDVHLRADIQTERDKCLRQADRFADEHVKDGGLILPRGEGDRR